MIFNHEDHEGHEEVYKILEQLDCNVSLVIEPLTLCFYLNSKEQVLVSS